MNIYISRWAPPRPPRSRGLCKEGTCEICVFSEICVHVFIFLSTFCQVFLETFLSGWVLPDAPGGVKVSRMSAFRETDRFTLNQHAALEHHHLQVFQHAGVARLVLFRCLLINCYFSRCCLSEASRKALHEHRFPFWNQTVASMSEELLVDAVAKKLRTLLEETRFSPYARVLNPYSKWIDSGTMFLDRRDGLSPCQDMLILILTVLTWDEEFFLSPRLLEKHLADIKYFGTFRSKEVWLDFAYMLLEHPSWYDLSLADCGRIQAEAGNWVWGDWDDRASKGIREIYASMYIFNAHLLIGPLSPATK